MSNNLTNNIDQLSGSVQKYIKVNIDLIKLTLIEKTAKIVPIIYILLIVLFFFLLILATGIAAFAVWYGETYNDYVGGLLIAGGGLLVLTLLLVIVGKILITNTIIKSFGGMLFSEDDSGKK